MIIGVPAKIKDDEYRIAMLPVGVELLSANGHTVLIEKEAGVASGFDDDNFLSAGAEIATAPDEIYQRADMIVKVKEPQEDEISKLRPGQIVFCYFHFAASRQLTHGCLNAKITAIAYETLKDSHGNLPLLTPMSEIAGMGANVTIMDINLDRLRYLDEVMPANVTTVYCDPHAVEKYAVTADLVIGAVLIPGGRTPILINRNLISKMKAGSVVIDVSVDQGGCIDTCKPTTHHEPTYIVDGVVHYCVANIPGAVSRTSSLALCNATLPYIRELAELGIDRFAEIDEGHVAGINIQNGRLVHKAIIAVFDDLQQ